MVTAAMHPEPLPLSPTTDWPSATTSPEDQSASPLPRRKPRPPEQTPIQAQAPTEPSIPHFNTEDTQPEHSEQPAAPISSSPLPAHEDTADNSASTRKGGSSSDTTRAAAPVISSDVDSGSASADAASDKGEIALDGETDARRDVRWEAGADSSDEEEEYRANFRRLFRKRTAADARVEAAVRGAVLRKRSRVGGRKEGKGGGRGFVDGLGGAGMLLGVEEVEEDLVALFGAFREAGSVEEGKKLGQVGVRRVGGRRVGVGGGKEFVKHGERKGWVVCVCCETEVWPPNINKHKAACRGRRPASVLV